MKLASGICPVPELLKLGVKIGLATDGCASNDNLDMIEEMRSAALIHKVASLRASEISAWDVLEMATVNGARILGLNEIGTLEPGKKADITIIDLRKPHLQPVYNIVKTLVYCARGSDVDTVIVNGEIIVERGRLTRISEEKVLLRVSKIVENSGLKEVWATSYSLKTQ